MKNKNKKAKIAIIGPYPPPYGGISVHIQRALFYLDKELKPIEIAGNYLIFRLEKGKEYNLKVI